MQHKNWSCPKCKNNEYEIGEMRVAGSFWQKIFNVQRTKFSSVTCSQCTYTEFFKGKTVSKLADVFDLFTT
ncbi:MAG: GTP-binding protein [Candidatus Marinimicrobia bacterium]|nr:GTP-binding protein [Candidatus Neomarinimicrobiota bacterium]